MNGISSRLNSEIDSVRNWLFQTYCSHAEEESKNHSYTDMEETTLVSKTRDVYIQKVGKEGTEFLETVFDSHIKLRVNLQKLQEHLNNESLCQNKQEDQFLKQLLDKPLIITRRGLRDYVAGALVRKGLISAPEGCIDGGVVRRALVPTAPYADVDIGYHVNSKFNSEAVKTAALDCVIEYIKSCFQKEASSGFLSPDIPKFISDIYLRKPYPISDSKYTIEKALPIGWVITLCSSDSVDIDLKFLMYSSRYRCNVATRDSFRAYFDVVSPNYHLYAIDDAILCDQKAFYKNLHHLQVNVVVIRNRETVENLFFRLLHDIHQGALPSGKDVQFAVKQLLIKYCIKNEGNFIQRYHHHCRNYNQQGMICDLFTCLHCLLSYQSRHLEEAKVVSLMVKQLVMAFLANERISRDSALVVIIKKLQNNPQYLKCLLELIWGSYLYESIVSSKVDFEFVAIDEHPETAAWRISVTTKETNASCLVVPPISPHALIRRFINALTEIKKAIGQEQLSHLFLELSQAHLAKDIENFEKVIFGLLAAIDKPSFSSTIRSHFSTADFSALYEEVESIFPEAAREYILPKKQRLEIQQGIAEAQSYRDDQSERMLITIRTFNDYPEKQQGELIPKLLLMCDTLIDIRNKPTIQKVLQETLQRLMCILTEFPSSERLPQMWQLMLSMKVAFNPMQAQEAGNKFFQLCRQQLQSKDTNFLCQLSTVLHACDIQDNPFISRESLELLCAELQRKLSQVILIKSNQFSNPAALSACLECMNALSLIKQGPTWSNFLPVVEQALIVTRKSDDLSGLHICGSMMLCLMQNGVQFDGSQVFQLLQLATRLLAAQGLSQHAYKHFQKMGNTLLAAYARQKEVDEKWRQEAQECLLDGMVGVLDQQTNKQQAFTFIKACIQVLPLSRRQYNNFFKLKTAVVTQDDNQIIPLFIQAMVALNFQFALRAYQNLRYRITSNEEQQRIDSQMRMIPILRQIGNLQAVLKRGDTEGIESKLKKLINLLKHVELLSLSDSAKVSGSIKTLLACLTIRPQQLLAPKIEMLLLDAHRKGFINDDDWIDVISTMARTVKMVGRESLSFIGAFATHQRLSALKPEHTFALIQMLLEEKQWESLRQVWLHAKILPLSKSQFEEICILMCQSPETLMDAGEFLENQIAKYPNVSWFLFEKMCSLNSILHTSLIKTFIKNKVLETGAQPPRVQRYFIFFKYFETMFKMELRGGRSHQKLHLSNLIEKWSDFCGSVGTPLEHAATPIVETFASILHLEGSLDSFTLLCFVYSKHADQLSVECGNYIFRMLMSFEQLGKQSFPASLHQMLTEAYVKAASLNHINKNDPEKVREFLGLLLKGMLNQIYSSHSGYLKALLNLNKMYMIDFLRVASKDSTLDVSVRKIIPQHLHNLIAVLINAEMESEIPNLLGSIQEFFFYDGTTAIKNCKTNMMGKHLETLKEERWNDEQLVIKQIEQTIKKLEKYGKEAPILGRMAVVMILTGAVEHKEKKRIRVEVNKLLQCASKHSLHMFPRHVQLSQVDKTQLLGEMSSYFSSVVFHLCNVWELGDHVFNLTLEMIKTVQHSELSIHETKVAEQLHSVIIKTNLLLRDFIINTSNCEHYLNFVRNILFVGLSNMHPVDHAVWATCLKDILDSLAELPAKVHNFDAANLAAMKGKKSRSKINTRIIVGYEDPRCWHVAGLEDKYRSIEQLMYEVLYAIIDTPLLVEFFKTKETRDIFVLVMGLLHASQLREEIIRGKKVNSSYCIQAIVERLTKCQSDITKLEPILAIIKAAMTNFISYPELIARCNKAKGAERSWKDWVQNEKLDLIVSEITGQDPQLQLLTNVEPSFPIGMVVDLLNDLSEKEQAILMSRKAKEVMLDQVIKLLQIFTNGQLFRQEMIKSETNKRVTHILKSVRSYVAIICEDFFQQKFNEMWDTCFRPYSATSTLLTNEEMKSELHVPGPLN